MPAKPKKELPDGFELTPAYVDNVLAAAGKNWPQGGLCNQSDPEAFFPEKGESYATATKVCMRCPVRRECLAFGLKSRDIFGMYGGYAPRERRDLVHKVYGDPSTKALSGAAASRAAAKGDREAIAA